MKTIRSGVFETNSSSCHVLTIMTEEEKRQLMEGERLLYVRSYACDDENAAYNSEIVDKARLRELIIGNIGEKDSEPFLDLIDKLVDAIFVGMSEYQRVVVEEVKKLGEKLPPEIYFQLEDVIHHCCHEESMKYITDNDKVVVKEVNGAKIYCSFWSKYY